MNTFIQKYESQVNGTLSGWDRIVFQGKLLPFYYVTGFLAYLNRIGVKLVDFTNTAKEKTQRLIESIENNLKQKNIEVQYLNSSGIRKDERAREIAFNNGIVSGVICAFSAVEPCRTVKIVGNRAAHLLEPKLVDGKCKHIYIYWFDEKFGFMSGRIETWYPFQVQFHLNGREYLARQMELKNMTFTRVGNCFTELGDITQSQELFDTMNDIDWCYECERLRKTMFPNFEELFGDTALSYYWTSYQTEWATDIMFQSHEELESIYPSLCRGAIEAFDAKEVMRFLGRQRNFDNPAGEVQSDYGYRVEGIRVKHWSLGNSVKMYDKAESVLRIETTINNEEPFKSFRSADGEEDGEKKWRPMRKGVGDMTRRGEVSNESNERYMEALSSIDTSERIGELVASACRSVKKDGKNYRGLNAFSEDDLKLIRAVNSGRFASNGFRNCDIAAELYGKTEDAVERRKNCSRVSYRLRLLRKHGLIRKVPNERRYHVSKNGRNILSALLQLQYATIQGLNACAA